MNAMGQQLIQQQCQPVVAQQAFAGQQQMYGSTLQQQQQQMHQLSNQEFMQMQHQAQHMKKFRKNVPQSAMDQAQQLLVLSICLI